eukprot:CAMPEP_0201921378 /NCGR_PEP_ID=MMETSP0903-20130614/9718_1 /ASSEMBLY_ACC=CAM_ASM_000552 /TAXON_ID=420261 /ORGANISM="Thalassiosira antarctica, Strain CCMP982" /LENGTH=702 /DNA_ID=CAMNT_0048458327 /DNA_START=84 /DNA_END=2192 /DNA_ORIENTATION=+
MTNYVFATLLLAITTFHTASATPPPTPPPTPLPQKFYPDWSGGTGTCIDQSVTPPTNNYIFIAVTGYLEDTLVDCCARYYQNTSYNDCITGGGGEVTGTGDFYVDWNSSPRRCVKDCPTSNGAPCGGLLGPGSGRVNHHNSADCCADALASIKQDYCVAVSEGGTWGGGGDYYLDTSENICVQDCGGAAPCGGIVTQSYITTYPTIELCCSSKLPSLDSAFCVAQSNPDSTGTNLWFVDRMVCKKDCVGSGDECGRASRYDILHDTAAECCSKMLNWMPSPEYCESRSDPDTYGVPSGSKSTGLWFVNYADNVCNKDCDSASTDAACADLSDGSSVNLYDTSLECCNSKLNWIDSSTCDTVSTSGAAAASTGTNKWYADFSSSKRCVMDCAKGSENPACGGIVANSAGESFYPDVVQCCSKKFQWYQKDLCKALSEVGAGQDAATNLWYVKYGSNMCVQDCPTGGAVSCGGNPSSFSEPMYTTAALCCAAKLNWLNQDQCDNMSTNGASSPTVGSDLWYADYNGKKCAKDCPDGAGAGCDGIVEATHGVAMYDTVAACCSQKFHYVDGDLCAAKSDGTGYTNKFYPEQGKSICHQDCATSTGGVCAGSPSDLSIAMYTDISSCCTSSVGWATKNKCEQIPATESGTEEYYVKWSAKTCVKNCDKSLGGDCGGLMETWDIPYGSRASCCSQPAFAWTDDCKNG